MLKIGKREKNWITVIGGIIFIVIFVHMVLKPLIGKMSQIQQKVKVIELKVKEGLKVQVRKDEILEEYNRYQVYLKQRDYSDQESEGNFLKELENIAQKSYLSVINLSPSDATERENHKVYNADFKAEGEIDEIFNFFNKIQENKLLIIIEKFTISPKDKSAQELRLDAKISMTTP